MQQGPNFFDSEQIARAVEILRAGGLVGLPTETVYGLAADARQELAVRRVFAVKGRPASHPVIVHLAGVESLGEWARQIPEEAQALAAAFWPGPLTLVLPRAAHVSDTITGGQDTVALRVPNHPVAREVLRLMGPGAGVAAPSANRYGKVSPTEAEHVRQELGNDVDLILDGGPCSVGLESTIVDCSSGALAVLRPGSITPEMLAQVLGRPVPLRGESAVRVPGQVESHYAPAAGVVTAPADRLAAEVERQVRAGRRVAVLSSTELQPISGATLLRIEGGLEAMARQLYARFRELDREGYEIIAVEWPEAAGVGLALRDRLSRASTGQR